NYLIISFLNKSICVDNSTSISLYSSICSFEFSYAFTSDSKSFLETEITKFSDDISSKSCLIFSKKFLIISHPFHQLIFLLFIFFLIFFIYFLIIPLPFHQLFFL